MRWTLLLIGPFVVIVGRNSISAPVAADSASNIAYAPEAGGAWKGLNSTAAENPPGSDNGGYGFQPWEFAGGYHDATLSPYGNLNHFIDGVDFTHSTFNNLGEPAFGLTNANQANFGYTARTTRVFSQALAVGGTFTFEFDNPVLAPLDSNDATGYIIRLNSGSGPKLPANPNVYERFGFFAQAGFHKVDWNVTDSTGSNDTGISSNATTSGAIFRLSLQSSETYSFQVLTLSGGAPLYSTTGSLASTNLGAVNTVEILMFGNGSGNGLTGANALPTGQRELFFNNLSLDNPISEIAGDYNHNGVVDAADYVLWRAGGSPNPNSPGDYNTWRTNFGATAASGMGISSTEVPEPTTATLFSVLLGFVLCARRPLQG